MNVTAVETLERRLKATRDAMQGELDRARNAAVQAAAARERANEHAATIAALEEAIEELRGWAPDDPGFTVELGDQRFTQAQWEAVQVYARGSSTEATVTSPLDVPCPSCQARAGDPCRSPTGETIEPHATRRAPA